MALFEKASRSGFQLRALAGSHFSGFELLLARIYWFSTKTISVLKLLHPGRGLKVIVLAVASKASAASFGEASSTLASETWPSSSMVIATLPSAFRFFPFSRYSGGLGWLKIAGGLRHAFGLL